MNSSQLLPKTTTTTTATQFGLPVYKPPELRVFYPVLYRQKLYLGPA